MSASYRLVLIIVLLMGQSQEMQAAPLDVDGDGTVGAQEAIDLSVNWKGPAGIQPWQVNGESIFYNLGRVGIGTTSPDTAFQVNDGRIRIRESATLERWDLFYDPPSGKFYLQENASYNHLVFTKGPAGHVGIGTDNPNAKLHVSTPSSTAVIGDSPKGNGVVGNSAATGFGATSGVHSGLNGIGVYGEALSGSMAYGVYGKSNTGFGVYGVGETGYGVYGTSPGGVGVKGQSTTNIGVEGASTDYWGVSGVSTSSIGVSGTSGQGTGVDGFSDAGIGVNAAGEIGLRATGKVAVSAHGVSGGFTALFGEDTGAEWAGVFLGDVRVIGDVEKSSSSVVIDHPLDPANKYLFHSSVESPDRMNLYNGDVVTDATGYAEVHLPDYFEALNRDFRYQLTVIDNTDNDQFVLAKVVKEIEGNRFTIRTSQPKVRISWQVTGIRNDPYAKANPVEVESVKKPMERDKYLNPDLYGQPKEKGIHHGVMVGPQTVEIPTTGRQGETK